jgi:glycogen synthase
MRVCLIAPLDDPSSELARSCRRRAELLAARHEVTAIYPPDADLAEPPSGPAPTELRAPEPAGLEGIAFASEDHRYSAAVLAAIERTYGSAAGPDYVEACDRGAPALVALNSRQAGRAPLRGSLFAIRLVLSGELRALHDGASSEPRARRVADLEREQFRLADRVVWPGGETLDLYGRHYSEDLPEPVRIGEPFPLPAELPAPTPHEHAAGAPLRILYAGPLQRHEGALDLAVACLRLPVDEWRLTMVGEDTPTAPAGHSVQLTIEAMLGGDPRLQIDAEPAGEGLRGLLAEHDLLVVPPTAAAWPEIALEAMQANLPILASPVGGLTELVEHGVTGWLAPSSGREALRDALTALFERREEVERLRMSGAIRERLRRLGDPGPVEEAYEGLLGPGGAPAPAAVRSPAGGAPRRATGIGEPLVSGIVPYFRASEYVEEAVGSLLEQTHARIEAIVVNDGSFEQDDDVLERLAQDPRVRVVTKLNSGDSSARNLGAVLARGEYLMMLDADNVLEREFVARALEAFAWDPDVAYVSSWLHFVAPDGSPVADPGGYAPLGNAVLREDSENWDADALALMPRGLFAEHGYGYEELAPTTSDWEFYRRLREDRRFGVVLPECLARYRVVPDSVLRSFDPATQGRAMGEALARRRLRNPAGYWGEAVG